MIKTQIRDGADGVDRKGIRSGACANSIDLLRNGSDLWKMSMGAGN